MDNEFVVWFSKSFGLFYLIALSIIIVAYAYWPSNKKQFDEAAQSILGHEDNRTGISHGGRRTRSLHRLHDHRPRMERHQGIEHAGAPAGLFLPDCDGLIRRHLLGADAGMAARCDLHQGPARHRSAHHRQRKPEAGRSRTRRLDQTHRGRKLQGNPGRSPIDGHGAADRPDAVRRQLRGVPRIERTGRQGISEPDDGVMALGRRSRKHCRNDPRRHQFRASAEPGRRK